MHCPALCFHLRSKHRINAGKILSMCGVVLSQHVAIESKTTTRDFIENTLLLPKTVHPNELNT